MIKAIIFDCFGVMQLGAHRALEEKFPHFQRELDELTKSGDYGFINQEEYIRRVTEITGTSHDEVVQIVIKDYHFNKDLAEYIKKSLKPYYKIGMLSNIGRGWVQNFFDEYQLHDIFDVAVLSGDEGVTKPHPQIYELAAERLNAEVEECIMIDDLPENIAGADAAGMQGIIYGNLRQMKQELEELLRA